jgi:HSP20 family protein
MTTTLRWSPVRELDAVERRMRRMLTEVGFGPMLLPAADIYETDDEYVVELEVPGFAEKELGIEVSDHLLTVRGERKETKDETDKAFRLRERLEREFERRFELPIEADTEHVKASFSDGVLAVHTPKHEPTKPHKIEITKD